MNFKKFTSAALAVSMLAVSPMALAEETTDSAERIAELEAQVTQLEAQITELEGTIAQYESADHVIEYDGGYVTAAQAQELYDTYAYYYQQYGMTEDYYGAQLKQDVLSMLCDETAVTKYAAENGLDQLSDEEMAAITEKAQATYEETITYYQSYFEEEGKDAEAVRADTIAYLEENGYTLESIAEDQKAQAIQEKVYEEAVKDVTMTDEELKTAYAQAVEEAKTKYADAGTYESARTNGELITYNPEGYRAVKHVLIKFSDEQSSTLTSLNAEMEKVKAAAEATEAPEGTEATTDGVATTEIARSQEEIQADIDALYAELMPTAQEVVDKFNDGTSIDDLIAEYGEDAGMTNEPTKSLGYCVSANSVQWDPAFTQGSMSIANVGEISEPVRGSYGLHIIYYMADITPGEVPLEEVKDAYSSIALENAKADAYATALESWKTEYNFEIHADRF